MDQLTFQRCSVQGSVVSDPVSACTQVLGHQAFSLPTDQMMGTSHAAHPDPPSQASGATATLSLLRSLTPMTGPMCCSPPEVMQAHTAIKCTALLAVMMLMGSRQCIMTSAPPGAIPVMRVGAAWPQLPLHLHHILLSQPLL